MLQFNNYGSPTFIILKIKTGNFETAQGHFSQNWCGTWEEDGLEGGWREAPTKHTAPPHLFTFALSQLIGTWLLVNHAIIIVYNNTLLNICNVCIIKW